MNRQLPNRALAGPTGIPSPDAAAAGAHPGRRGRAGGPLRWHSTHDARGTLASFIQDLARRTAALRAYQADWTHFAQWGAAQDFVPVPAAARASLVKRTRRCPLPEEGRR
jgi:hypothetical protein